MSLSGWRSFLVWHTWTGMCVARIQNSQCYSARILCATLTTFPQVSQGKEVCSFVQELWLSSNSNCEGHSSHMHYYYLLVIGFIKRNNILPLKVLICFLCSKLHEMANVDHSISYSNCCQHFQLSNWTFDCFRLDANLKHSCSVTSALETL